MLKNFIFLLFTLHCCTLIAQLPSYNEEIPLEDRLIDSMFKVNRQVLALELNQNLIDSNIDINTILESLATIQITIDTSGSINSIKLIRNTSGIDLFSDICISYFDKKSPLVPQHYFLDESVIYITLFYINIFVDNNGLLQISFDG